MRNQKWVTGMVALCLASATLLNAQAEEKKMIADFNAPSPNNVNGDFGAFSPNPDERVFLCNESLDETIRQGSTGSSLRLTYNVDNGGAYNGFWLKFGPADTTFDGSAYTKVTFWIRGDSKVGIPNKIKVELKSAGKIASHYVGEITGDWKKIEIPLSEISKAGVDLSKLTEMTFVFEQRYASPGTVGAINIDDIALEK